MINYPKATSDIKVIESLPMPIFFAIIPQNKGMITFGKEYIV
jgi:hypothetical protein